MPSSDVVAMNASGSVCADTPTAENARLKCSEHHDDTSPENFDTLSSADTACISLQTHANGNSGRLDTAHDTEHGQNDDTHANDIHFETDSECESEDYDSDYSSTCVSPGRYPHESVAAALQHKRPILARQLTERKEEQKKPGGNWGLGMDISSLICNSLLLPKGSISLPISPAAQSPPADATSPQSRPPARWWGALHSSYADFGLSSAPSSSKGCAKGHQESSRPLAASQARVRKPITSILPFRPEWEIKHLFDSPRAQDDLVNRVLSGRAKRFPDSARSRNGGEGITAIHRNVL